MGVVYKPLFVNTKEQHEEVEDVRRKSKMFMQVRYLYVSKQKRDRQLVLI